MRDKIIEIIARQLCALAFDANEGGTFSYKVVDERWRDWAPDASVAYDALEAANFAVVPVEPTESMVAHGGAAVDHPSVFMGGPSRGGKMTAERAYAAMLKAAKESQDG